MESNYGPLKYQPSTLPLKPQELIQFVAKYMNSFLKLKAK
jgi:hypothetical protein